MVVHEEEMRLKMLVRMIKIWELVVKHLQVKKVEMGHTIQTAGVYTLREVLVEMPHTSMTITIKGLAALVVVKFTTLGQTGTNVKQAKAVLPMAAVEVVVRQ